MAVALLLVTADVVLVATAPAAAAQAKPKQAKDLPPVPSAAQPKIQPEVPKGDFADPPPHPEELETAKQPKKDSFDPGKSKLLEAETTPTKKSFSNADGTRTDVISTRPTRYQDPSGNWQDIDLTLVGGPGGTLVAKSAKDSAGLPARADGGTTLGPLPDVSPSITATPAA